MKSCALRCVLCFVSALAGAVLFGAPAQAAPNVQEEKFDSGRFTMSRFSWQDQQGAPVSYYLSSPAARAPLVLYIQGSGFLSTEVLYAELRAQGRDVGLRRIPTADHSLVPEGGSLPPVQDEYDRIMRWFEQDQGQAD